MGDNRVNAVSLMVNVLDPQKDDSEVGALVSEHGIELARQRSAKKGILEGDSLGRMFAWMRPNDLIWNYVINNYLMGQDPPPFGARTCKVKQVRTVRDRSCFSTGSVPISN